MLIMKKVYIYTYIYNTVMNNRSHCDCDEDFLNCLKRSRNSYATMLGNFYFNVLKVQCIQEERPVICVDIRFYKFFLSISRNYLILIVIFMAIIDLIIERTATERKSVYAMRCPLKAVWSLLPQNCNTNTLMHECVDHMYIKQFISL